jgi:TonB family protein
MKIGYLALLTVGTSSIGLADFSYAVTRKPAPLSGSQTEKHYFKGQKMKVESADGSTIVDFDAQTVTRINNMLKSYSVTKFSDIPAPPKQTEVDVKVYVQETGRTQIISGYKANEVVLTADLDSPQIRQRPGKPQTEKRVWVATDLPGSDELRAFYERNRERFPWMALAEGGQQQAANATAEAVQAAAVETDRRKTELKGVPVLEVSTLRIAPGGSRGPNIQDWAQARAQLEAQSSKGGPGANTAAQALARAESMGGDPFALMQNTFESSGFSTEPIPDSVFAIAAEYKLVSAADLSREGLDAVRAKQSAAGGVPGGLAGAVIGGIIGSVPTGASPPPPPVKVENSAVPRRIRVGSNVQAAKLIRQPKPIYPPLAKQGRISGHVILNAIIGKDGAIQNLTFASGHPLLVPAAMEAVKQWVYQPTVLNGEPAEVVTQIDVNFTLSDGPRALQAGQVGQLYRQVLQADGPTAGGTQTWSLLSGNLPSGLSLDASTGAISGYPTSNGDYAFSLSVKNGDREATVNLSIHIDSEQ